MTGIANHKRHSAALDNGAGSRHLGNLDFLRGCAAFYVVLFHFSTRVSLRDLMFHGYLAVDFFYCLSGVVIYRSYSAKIFARRIGFKSFLWMRLVRLIPLVLLGNTIAALIDFFRPGEFSFSMHARDIAVTYILGTFLLPIFYKTTLEDGTYPLNGPVWSLFFEFIANLVFFSIARSRFSSLIYKLFLFFIRADYDNF